MNGLRATTAEALRLIGWTVVLLSDVGTAVGHACFVAGRAGYDLGAAIGHAASRIRGPP